MHEIVPVLKAISLDIRKPETHTDLMLSCRNGALYRTLTLLGLVLVFLVIAGDGWAQFLAESGDDVAKYTQYPFLGIDNTQRNMLINAFNFQSRIFSMLSGTGVAKVQAFSILSVLGALIGALLLFFNAKIRKPIIIGPWLIVLILLVFAPYGSKLLFYPVTQESLEPVFKGPRPNIVAKDCNEAPEICGFAPQVAAIHVASSLQLLFSDAFRSAGWKGLMESFKSRSEMASESTFVLNDQVAGEIALYDSKCRAPITDHIDAMYKAVGITPPTGAGQSTTPQADQKSPPVSFYEQWNNSIDSINRANIDISLVPPPAVELWDDASFTAAMNENGWGASVQSEYEAGLTYLFNAAGGVGTVRIKSGSSQSGQQSGTTPQAGQQSGSSSVNVSAEDALKKLDEYGFFKVNNGTNLASGYFVRWEKATNFGSISAEEARKCYIAGSAKSDWPIECNESALVHPTPQINFVKENFVNGDSSIFTAPQWQIMAPIRSSGSALSRMPVKPLTYKEGGVTDSGSVLPAVIDKGVGARTEVNGYNCEVEGVRTLKNMVELIVGPNGSANNEARTDMFSNTQKLLLGEVSLPNRIALKDICNDVTNPDTAQEACNTAGGGESIEKTTRLGQNVARIFDEILTTNSNKSEYEKRKMLLNGFYTMVRDSSGNAKKTDSEAVKLANQDGSRPELVGARWLTSLGGGIAIFLGSFLVEIGSWLVGPLAAAIIFFLSMLVDMSLLILIILTPFLLLAGLFVPGNAIGVLTVSIVGVFVLKFVPVTLVILNYLGSMVYTFIGAGAPDELAKTMQSMIVIAMGGLYASLVTMTFFLLFKMGDASAILSRFTALDSNAKQVAETGMKAAKSLALMAASYGTAALGGAAFGLAGNYMRNKGPGGDSSNRIQNAATEGLQEVEDNQLRDKDGNPLAGANGVPYTAAEQERIRQNGSGITRAMNEFGLSEDKATELFAKGSVTDEHGNEFGIGSNGQAVFTSAAAQSILDDNKGAPITELQARDDEASMLAKASAGTFNSNPSQPQQSRHLPTEEQISAQRAQQQQQAERQGSLSAGANSGSPAIAQEVQQQQAVAGGGGGSGDNNGNAGGGPASRVVIDGGNLDGVGQVGSVQSMGGSTEQRRLDMEADQIAQDGMAAQQRLNNLLEDPTLSEEAKSKLRAERESIMGANDKESIAAANRMMDKTLSESGVSQGILDKRSGLMRNLNQQMADKIVQFEQEYAPQLEAIRNKKPNELSDLEKRVKSHYESMMKLDTAGVTQGQMLRNLASLDNLKASMDARGAADIEPNNWQSFKSGFYGGLKGISGGFAKIPIVGPALAEAVNEYYEAPERARAWNAVGGKSNWKALQTDSQRLGFFQKAITPIAGGTQYREMQDVGAFQAQVDISRQAAQEAVARSRTQWEAMYSSQKANFVANFDSNERMKLEMDLKGNNSFMASLSGLDSGAQSARIAEEVNRRIENTFATSVREGMSLGMSSADLSGIGRYEAADKVYSLRQEAALMQSASVSALVAKGGLDHNMLLKENAVGDVNAEMEKVNVVLTPDALSKFRGDIKTKEIAGRFDDMMVNHYGIAEKQYLRGDVDWNRTRNMTTNIAAAATYARQDVDTDYTVGGHLKMVQGKEKFMESRGQYQKLIEMRHDENALKSREVHAMISRAGGDLAAALKNIGHTISRVDLNPAEMFTQQRNALESAAKKSLSSQNTLLPLDAIFVNAQINGTSKYEQKALTSLYEASSQEQENRDRMQKAASEMYLARMSGVMDFDRKVSMRSVGGVNYDIGKAKERLFDKIASVIGGDLRSMPQIDRVFMDVMSENKDKIKIQVKGGKNNKSGTASFGMDESVYKTIIERMEKTDGLQKYAKSFREQLADPNSRSFRKRGNEVIWGLIDTEKEEQM